MKIIGYYVEIQVPDDESQGSIDGVEKMLVEATERKGYNVYHSEHYEVREQRI